MISLKVECGYDRGKSAVNEVVIDYRRVFGVVGKSVGSEIEKKRIVFIKWITYIGL